jgi:hypothetical protein
MDRIEVSGIEALVCADIAHRQQVGVGKYKTTVIDNPLPPEAWLNHLYEELLDAAVYAKNILYKLNNVKHCEQ